MKKINMKKVYNAGKKVLTTSVILVYLIFGCALLVRECVKVADTGLKLIFMYDNTMIYNENPKTNTGTEDFKKKNEERQKIYNSSDWVVRKFSNLSRIPKFLIWIFSIISIPAVPVVTLYIILEKIKKVRDDKLRIKRAQRRQNKSEDPFLIEKGQEVGL